ncbi:MAG TPA: hypothetical protein PLK77_01085 [Pyrinomonadaceae bacterium]|nr:hypothetical protein [Pyrinomonadaceae bacterium]
MINHISIAVNEPERVANFLAEVWEGIVYPFPPVPGGFFVIANDGNGTAVEVTPAGTILVPGEGLPDENDLEASTEEHEAQFIKSEFIPRYVATHLNINTKKSIDEIREIANREDWRVLVCNRGGGLFQLVEVWLENTFMLEVMTPEQTERYIEITDPKFMAAAFEEALKQSHPVRPEIPTLPSELNVIG